MTGSVVIIVNPAATRSRGGLGRAAADAVARAGRPVEVHETRHPGDGARLARGAAAAGAELAVTVGGDGLTAEVLGALAGRRTLAATLPGGNANVLARAIGWPARPGAALAALEMALTRGGETRELSMWRIRAGAHDRLIALNAGFGLDAEAVRRVEAHQRSKRRLRQAAFVGAALASAGRIRRLRPTIAVAVDDGAPVACRSLITATGHPFSYVGRRPIELLRPVDFDGRLAWLGLVRVDAATIARVASGILLGRGGIPERCAVSGTALRRLVAESDTPLAVQADGEPLGVHRRIELGPAGDVAVFTPSLTSGGRGPR